MDKKMQEIYDLELRGKEYSVEEREKDNENYYVRADLLGKCSHEAIVLQSILDSDGVMSNKELAAILGVSEASVAKYLKELRDLRVIKTNLSQEDILKELQKQTKPYVCDWCNMNVNLLEDHHYPIPARQGGKNLVSVCPNCHKMFHKLETYYNGGMQNE